MDNLIEQIIKHYKINQQIGQGGMGTVYRGTNTHTQEPVAIKALKADVATPDMIARFKREGEMLRELNHPNIVKMLDAVEENGQHYLIMEFIKGGSLRDVLKREPKMPVQRILEIALEVADALTRAHHLKIIHRDIKPANILLSDDGTPHLTDFGSARTGKSDMTDSGIILGTFAYLSPEELNEEAASPRSDIWSFGIMLYEMLVGERPFKGEQAAALVTAIFTHPLPDIEQLCPDAPAALVDLIYRMLAKIPAERIPSVRVVGMELEAILQGRAGDIAPRKASQTEAEDDTQTLMATAIEKDRFATPTPADDRPRHNLSAQTTPFVGREAELAELDKLLKSPDIRLITVLASGGMGKTRLVLESGERLLNDNQPFVEDGVFFVDLAPLMDSDNIPNAIATATGYPFQQDSRSPKQQILDFLSFKKLLLIMDNFEHLLDGAEMVTDILKAAPGVSILATSRQKLKQSTETVFNLGGLAFPDWETPEDALQYSAVKLFMQSAKRVHPDFELQADKLKFVARICRLVEGLPLGILLAAAWLDTLSLEEIADEISQSLDFLETDMSDLPERQRSIRAVFDYSWKLMSEAEQQIFIKLAVFRGGFTREAAQKVAGASIRNLQSLVNKSLIRRDVENGRYALHEMLRQYAEERLKNTGAFEATATTHAAYYGDFIQQREIDLKGKRSFEALGEIDIELDNVKAAWSWALAHQHNTPVGKLMSGMWYYFNMKSDYSGGADFFHEALAFSHDSILHGKIKTRYGQRCVGLNRFDEAESHLRKSLEIARKNENPVELLICITGLITIATNRNSDYEAAETMVEEALQIARDCQEAWWICLVLNLKNYVKGQSGEQNQMLLRRIMEEVRDLAQASGNEWRLTHSLNNLALTYATVGDYEQAIAMLQKAVVTFEKYNILGATLVALSNLSAYFRDRGHYEQALHYAETLIRHAKATGQWQWVCSGMIHRANRLSLLGQHQEAIEVLKEASGILTRLDNPEMFQVIIHLVESWIAYRQGEFEAGLNVALQMPALAEKLKNPLGFGEVYYILALLEIQMGQLENARQHWQTGLRNRLTLIQKIIAIYTGAALCQADDQYERAVELATLVANHHATFHEFKGYAQTLLEKLESQLPADIYQAALERGKARDLEITFQKLQEEFNA